jgi:hypothetical protein
MVRVWAGCGFEAWSNSFQSTFLKLFIKILKSLSY